MQSLARSACEEFWSRANSACIFEFRDRPQYPQSVDGMPDESALRSFLNQLRDYAFQRQCPPCPSETAGRKFGKCIHVVLTIEIRFATFRSASIFTQRRDAAPRSVHCPLSVSFAVSAARSTSPLPCSLPRFLSITCNTLRSSCVASASIQEGRNQGKLEVGGL